MTGNTVAYFGSVTITRHICPYKMMSTTQEDGEINQAEGLLLISDYSQVSYLSLKSFYIHPPSKNNTAELNQEYVANIPRTKKNSSYFTSMTKLNEPDGKVGDIMSSLRKYILRQ